MSHGTNLSAGVAILFSKHLDLNILSSIELEKGRILMAIVEIKELKFLFINVYAPNVGLQQIELFGRLKTEIIKHVDEGMCVIMGGDWNCTTSFVLHLHYIYIYAFSRRFYPKRLTLHSSYSFYI